MISPTTGLTRIREVYHHMGDAELLSFAQEEGLKLSMEAYLVLKAELEKRNTGDMVIRQLEHQIIVQYSLREKKFEQDIFTDLFISSLEYALEEKQKGSRQYTIYAGLVERGIQAEYANYMVNQLDEWAEQLRREALLKLYAGIGIGFTAVVVLYIALSIHKLELPAGLLLVFGLTFVVISWRRKNKFKKITKAILLERKNAG